MDRADAAALLIGWWHPAGWLLAPLLAAILATVWLFAVVRLFRTGNVGRAEWSGAGPGAGSRALNPLVTGDNGRATAGRSGGWRMVRGAAHGLSR